MELRDIEIFLTLAEELHFGRTAARLHVSVPRVSKAIKKQERGIGAELFVRDSRNVRLTTVGQQLRNDLRPVYRSLRESMERARLAAQGKTDVLRVGMIPTCAHDLRPFWEAFRSRHPDCGLQIRHNPFVDAFAPLRKGEIDLLVAWLPLDEPDFTSGPVILTEPRVLVAAPGHELADRESVSLDVYGDFPIPDATVRGPGYWADAWLSASTPSGRAIVPGPHLISNLDEMLTYVSSGEGIHLLGAHAARYHARPDLAYLPIRDAPLLSWGLFWRTEAETSAIRAFAQTVRDLGTLSL